MFSKKVFCSLWLALTMSGASFADTFVLNPSAPERYTVVKGDTLWGISAAYLRDPWLWPEIWQINPEIENPHLIYPGDIIALTYDKDGRPRLSIQSRARPTVKMSPKVRETRIDNAISPIPTDAIQQFLTRASIVSKEEYDQAPYIVAFQEDRITASTDNKAYVRDLKDSDAKRYTIVRLGEPYRNPGAKRNDILGYEAIEVANARLIKTGDPSTFIITDLNREVLLGDRLFPAKDINEQLSYMPHAPKNDIAGLIISVLDGVSRIGQYHVVVINVGENESLEPGHVLEVYQSGRTVRDTFSNKKGHARVVTLPDERAGIIMVFRTFSKVSYALVMSATQDMRLYDKVKTPISE